MNYPIWDVPRLGGPLLIAIVSILHVYVAMFAVGGSWYLVAAERWARRTQNADLLAYVKNHSRFFLLLTVVFGALTGVGIWFTIGLINPQTTSVLIRTFVWGWAMEWVFFILEIASILLYVASWDRADGRTHLLYGYSYVVGSTMSLVIINGILSFMLTPGRWLETGNFWDGFFNPTYLPSLVGRIAAAAALAGLWGLFTGVKIGSRELREQVVRFASWWLVPPMVVLPLSAVWYVAVVPSGPRSLVMGGAAAVSIMFMLSLALSVVIFAVGALGPLRRPALASSALAWTLLAAGLITTGGTEWVREGIRKPYTIYGYLYSNGVFAWQERQLAEAGVLSQARFARPDLARVATAGMADPAQQIAVGAEIFRLQCSSCHVLDGYNDVKPLVKGWSEQYIDFQLSHLDMLKGYMPPFFGTTEERQALARWLATLNPATEATQAEAPRRPLPGEPVL
ncbi:cytochrome ubiquinol oxidase subunit I [Carboxydochorda subterranea]|uniref:Cytochrome ubiquinol oxidase subunit I n=1 Tax=Carboxydichorda subterranea TaxID=3109565 RepID=A0ABZ1BUM6_9FIRM|nr:cytochrome ubiquinol oxidase subunit I [Limnochorda sp. L945t]WRP16494.1 cytochrome ubiquinol oxidase subunit I [Limnochorda sp. L945t]